MRLTGADGAEPSYYSEDGKAGHLTIVHGRDTCRNDGYIRLTVINGIVNCELLKSSEDDAIVWAYARLHR